MDSTMNITPALAPALGMPTHGSSFAAAPAPVCTVVLAAAAAVRDRALNGAVIGDTTGAIKGDMGREQAVFGGRATAVALPEYHGSPPWSPS